MANAITLDSLIDYINEKDDSNNLAMPNNKELFRNIKNTEFPNNKGLFILYMLESKLRNDPKHSTQLLKYTSYTLDVKSLFANFSYSYESINSFLQLLIAFFIAFGLYSC